MDQCFYMRANPKQRCPNKARWIARPGVCYPPTDKFVWCDDHRYENDVLISEQHYPSSIAAPQPPTTED